MINTPNFAHLKKYKNMIKRIHNEKNITQRLTEGRGEARCCREQQAYRFRHRFSVEEHKIKHLKRCYL